MGRHRHAASRDTPLSSRLWDKAHWLLWEAGKGLAILLLALAGGHGVWGARGERGGLGGHAAGGCLVRGESLVQSGDSHSMGVVVLSLRRGMLGPWGEEGTSKGKSSVHGGRDVWSRGENSPRRGDAWCKGGECAIQGGNLNPWGDLLTLRDRCLIRGGRDACSGEGGDAQPKEGACSFQAGVMLGLRRTDLESKREEMLGPRWKTWSKGKGCLL